MTDYHKPESPDGLQWQQLGRQKRSYLMQDFCRIGLPIRNPGPDTAKWVRTNGNLTYVLHPHTIKRDDGGVTHIWPYGKKARLLLVWISTQVVRQKDYNTDRVIMLPSTLRGLMADLGMRRKPRPADYDDFSHQISALSNFHMTITRTGTRLQMTLDPGEEVTLVEKADIGWSRYAPKGAGSKGPYIKLTQDTWDRMARSTPLSAEIVEMLTMTGEGFGFDIYAWLSQRIYALNHSRYHQTQVIPWATLQKQMGSEYAETRNFVTYFKKGLRHVAALWDAALVDAGKEGRLRYSFERGGLRLYRSPELLIETGHDTYTDYSALPLPELVRAGLIEAGQAFGVGLVQGLIGMGHADREAWSPPSDQPHCGHCSDPQRDRTCDHPRPDGPRP